jgi:hypothetical protein
MLCAPVHLLIDIVLLLSDSFFHFWLILDVLAVFF